MRGIRLPPGSLWSAARARAAEALALGALQPIATRPQALERGGVTFQARVLEGVRHKEVSDRTRAGADPFLPYDERLFVCDVSDTHVCLLNRFPVLDDHLLVVTRRFEAQEDPLGLADFAALEACLCEGDALAFYNAGRPAGASQRHRHLQLVPLPLGGGPERLPVERLLEPVLRDAAPRRGDGEDVRLCDALPFRHALARLDPEAVGRARGGGGLRTGGDRGREGGARRLLAAYEGLRRAAGVRGAAPYNLLATRAWMLMVPRTQEASASIGVNALGFAGAFLVRDREQLALLREIGPLALLARVAPAAPSAAARRLGPTRSRAP